MTELSTLIALLKMCGILAMNGNLQPSESFNCRQAEQFTVEYLVSLGYPKHSPEHQLLKGHPPDHPAQTEDEVDSKRQ